MLASVVPVLLRMAESEVQAIKDLTERLQLLKVSDEKELLDSVNIEDMAEIDLDLYLCKQPDQPANDSKDAKKEDSVAVDSPASPDNLSVDGDAVDQCDDQLDDPVKMCCQVNLEVFLNKCRELDVAIEETMGLRPDDVTKHVIESMITESAIFLKNDELVLGIQKEMDIFQVKEQLKFTYGMSDVFNFLSPGRLEELPSGDDAMTWLRQQHEYVSRNFSAHGDLTTLDEPDIDFVLGEFIFHCHKQIWSSQSGFFKHFFINNIMYSDSENANANDTNVVDSSVKRRICLPVGDIKANDFSFFFRYIYLGEIEDQICLENLFMVNKAAIALDIVGLRHHCIRYFNIKIMFLAMLRSCVWTLKAISEVEFGIEDLHTDYNFVIFHPGWYVVKDLLENKNFRLSDELQAVHLVFWWLLTHNVEAMRDELEVIKVLESIRWSAVPMVFTKEYANMPGVANLPLVTKHLNRILDLYYTHGIQFEGLRTFIRPSLRFTRCLVFLGYDQHIGFTNLQRGTCSKRGTYSQDKPVPTNYDYLSISGAVYTNPAYAHARWDTDALYGTGMGKRYNQIWKFEFLKGWKRCSNLEFARSEHSSVFVGQILFTCGGVSERKNRNRKHRSMCDCIEEYDIGSNKAKRTGARLAIGVSRSACVAYKQHIYLFGGRGLFCEQVDHVQRYDTNLRTCVLLTRALSLGQSRRMAPVVCDRYIILFRQNDCVFYDIEHDTCSSRQNCHPGYEASAAAVDDGSVFLLGKLSNNDCWSNEVQRADLGSILRADDYVEWITVGSLPLNFYPAYARGVLTLPEINRTG